MKKCECKKERKKDVTIKLHDQFICFDSSIAHQHREHTLMLMVRRRPLNLIKTEKGSERKMGGGWKKREEETGPPRLNELLDFA